MAITRKGPAAFVILVMIALGVGRLVQQWPREQGPRDGGNGFERLEGCTLVSNRANDGDSFFVKGPGGEIRHLRLYFVDAPERGVRQYSDGNDNVKRLGHQGDYFGGLSQGETVRVGQDAGRWVITLLAEAQPFTVFTRGKEVYGGPRTYALVRVKRDGRESWLHELLVEQGLARIYTEGTDLPDGTARKVQLRRLRELERAARRARKGAWGLANGANRS